MVFTTSVTCVVRSTCGDARCARSPIPVSDGVKTSCPASCSGPRTYLNPYDPPHAPCTRTNVVMARTLDRLAGSRKVPPPQICAFVTDVHGVPGAKSGGVLRD